MAKDNKYSFFESYHNALARVSDERYGRIVRAMSAFVFKQEGPNFKDDADWIVWELIRPILEKGLEISKNRAEAGANGGRNGRGVSRNKGNRNASKSTPEAKAKQKQNNSKQKQNNSGIGIGLGKDKDIDSSLHSESPLSTDNVCARPQSTKVNSAFENWLQNNCEYIAKHYTLPSEEEFAKLKSQYGAEKIAETCLQIENRKDLRKKYSNLYRTLLNWLKRDSSTTIGGSLQTDDAAVQRAYNIEIARELGKADAKKVAEARRRQEVVSLVSSYLAEDE